MKPVTLGLTTLAGAGAVALLCWSRLPARNMLGPRSPEATEMSEGLQIYRELQAYAKDHQGKFPAALDTLEPTYISDTAKGGLEASGPPFGDWLYFPEARADQPNAIILASPHLFTHPGAASRMAINSRGVGSHVLPERLFVSRIIYQMREGKR